ncbi:MAG: hypothetical protein ACYCQJ_14245 [Nitrososphaerales archaeon]
MASPIPFDTFEPSRLIAPSPNVVPIKNQNGAFRLYLKYRMPDGRLVEPVFEIGHQEEIVVLDIPDQNNPNKINYRMPLPIRDPDMVTKFEQLYHRLLDISVECRSSLGLPDGITREKIIDVELIKNKLSYPKDKTTKQRIDGDPSVWLTVDPWTKFKIPNPQDPRKGKPVEVPDFKVYLGKKLTCLPFFSITNIYKGGGKWSPQYKLADCLVFKDEPARGVNFSNSTYLSKFMDQNPNLISERNLEDLQQTIRTPVVSKNAGSGAPPVQETPRPQVQQPQGMNNLQPQAYQLPPGFQLPTQPSQGYPPPHLMNSFTHMNMGTPAMTPGMPSSTPNMPQGEMTGGRMDLSGYFQPQRQ